MWLSLCYTVVPFHLCQLALVAFSWSSRNFWPHLSSSNRRLTSRSCARGCLTSFLFFLLGTHFVHLHWVVFLHQLFQFGCSPPTWLTWSLSITRQFKTPAGLHQWALIRLLKSISLLWFTTKVHDSSFMQKPGWFVGRGWSICCGIWGLFWARRLFWRLYVMILTGPDALFTGRLSLIKLHAFKFRFKMSYPNYYCDFEWNLLNIADFLIILYFIDIYFEYV